MRLSVRQDDPGYHPLAYRCHVLVDDVEVPECFTADEELGVAYCYAIDRHGRLVMDDGELGEVQIRGRVQIVVPNDWKPKART